MVDKQLIDPFRPSYTYTYEDILNSYSDGFIDLLFRVSLVYLGFQLVMMWYFWNFEPKNDKEKWVRLALWVSFPVSMFFPVIILGYKTGWFI